MFDCNALNSTGVVSRVAYFLVSRNVPCKLETAKQSVNLHATRTAPPCDKRLLLMFVGAGSGWAERPGLAAHLDGAHSGGQGVVVLDARPAERVLAVHELDAVALEAAAADGLDHVRVLPGLQPAHTGRSEIRSCRTLDPSHGKLKTSDPNLRDRPQKCMSERICTTTICQRRESSEERTDERITR